MKYRVLIKETISQEFTVEADSFEEAEINAITYYYQGILVLDNSNLISKQIAVQDNDGILTDFIKF